MVIHIMWTNPPSGVTILLNGNWEGAVYSSATHPSGGQLQLIEFPVQKSEIEVPADYLDSWATRFHQSLNQTTMGIFSASNASLRVDPSQKFIFNRGVASQTCLQYTYGVKPGYYDWKIDRFESFLLDRFYNKEELKRKAKDLLHQHTKKFLERKLAKLRSGGKSSGKTNELETLLKQELLWPEYKKITQIESLSSYEKQLVAYYAMTELSNDCIVEYTPRDVAIALNIEKDQKRVTESARIRQGTILLPETSFYFADDKSETSLLISPESIAKIDIITRSDRGGGNRLFSRPHPLLLLNWIEHRTFDNDLQLLTSFHSPIAAMLSEHLRLRLFGVIEKHTPQGYTTMTYEQLTNLLQLTPRAKHSQVLRQLEQSFDELIEKQIVGKWEMPNYGHRGVNVRSLVLRIFPHVAFKRRYIDKATTTPSLPVSV